MNATRCSKSGFTSLELLVTLAIMGVLLSLLLPSVQHAREVSRRTICSLNLSQIALAALNYESSFRQFPLGIDHKYALLPFLEQGAVFDLKNDQGTTPEEIWGKLAEFHFGIFECPSDGGDRTFNSYSGPMAGTSYHANAGNGVLANGFNGVYGYGQYAGAIYPDRAIRTADIIDGLSSTSAFAEALLPGQNVRVQTIWLLPTTYFSPNEISQLASDCDQLPLMPVDFGYVEAEFSRGFPWYGGGMGMSLYTHTLTPNRPSCTNGTSVLTGIYSAASVHPSGVNVAFSDGHVRFVSEDVDRQVWSLSGSRRSDEFVFPF